MSGTVAPGEPEPSAGTDDDRLRYRLLTGPDDQEFCRRVSRALDDGYVLYGSPAITSGPDGPIVCQAVILAD